MLISKIWTLSVGSMLLAVVLRQRATGMAAAFSTKSFASTTFLQQQQFRDRSRLPIAFAGATWKQRRSTTPMNQRSLQMNASTVSTGSSTGILPRIKAVDATKPTDGPVLVKGWVRTVRKQKTLAFVEVNDGSNMGGIQCVLSFDIIDEDSKAGKL